MHHSGGGQQHLASCSISRSPKNPSESRTKNAAPPTARQPSAFLKLTGWLEIRTWTFSSHTEGFLFQETTEELWIYSPSLNQLDKTAGQTHLPSCSFSRRPETQQRTLLCPHWKTCSKIQLQASFNSIALLQALLLGALKKKPEHHVKVLKSKNQNGNQPVHK